MQATDTLLQALSKDELLNLVKRISEHLKENYNLTDEQVLELSKKEIKPELLIPVSIFSHELSPSEAIVKYLKEEFDFNYHKISLLISRDERGVWASYQRSLKKQEEKFTPKKPDLFVPVSIFSNKKLSILESLILHLKDTKDISGSKISSLLNKKPSTIWTAYKRAKQKNEK